MTPLVYATWTTHFYLQQAVKVGLATELKLVLERRNAITVTLQDVEEEIVLIRYKGGLNQSIQNGFRSFLQQEQEAK